MEGSSTRPRTGVGISTMNTAMMTVRYMPLTFSRRCRDRDGVVTRVGVR